MSAWGKSAVFTILLLLIANLAFIDIRLFFSKPITTSSQPVQTTILPSRIPTPTPIEKKVIESMINEATGSVLRQIQNKPLGGAAPIEPVTQIVTAPSIKEFYIPLGAGTTTSKDWQDIAGSDTTIDPNNYPNLKSAYFEVSLSVPTNSGTAYARLFNVTDKHPAWFAEVQTDNAQSILVKSGPIVLGSGNSVYRVQLKSSIGAQVVMDLARVKIVIE